MQLVLFTGIQAAGKSTFFQARFFHTHVRINLDMLRTRHREQLLFAACIEGKQPVVIDNTNLTRETRARYIGPAKAAGFEVVGYYFRSVVAESVARNASREGKRKIPDRGIFGAAGSLETPHPGEGYDSLFYVRIGGGDAGCDDGGFLVEPWL